MRQRKLALDWLNFENFNIKQKKKLESLTRKNFLVKSQTVARVVSTFQTHSFLYSMPKHVDKKRKT